MQRSLILGGTKGLGASIARLSAEAGIQPVIVGRSKGKIAEMKLAGGEGMIFDLSEISDSFKFAHSIPGDIETISHIFWVVGVGQQGPMKTFSGEEMMRIFSTVFLGPFIALHSINVHRQTSYHLVVVCSATSWKIRDNELAYGSAKAAQAQAARNISRELDRDLPGSRVTLVHPGGMRTPFWDNTGVDTSSFLDPDKVARIIWDHITGQKQSFLEFQIHRQKDGSPLVEYGPRLPE